MAKHNPIVLSVLALCLLFPPVHAAFGAEGAADAAAGTSAAATARYQMKILLINSNAAVEKYRVAQEEFRLTLSDHMIFDVDLGGREAGRATRRKIRDFNPDLVYAVGALAYSLAIDEFKDERIVFSSIINWLRLPVSDKTYGVSNELHSRMPLMMFRYIFPAIKRIGVLYSARYTEEWFEFSRKQAGELGITLVGIPIERKGRSLAALDRLFEQADALWLVPDPLVMPDESYLYKILEACDEKKRPVFGYHSAFPYFGAVLSVAADNPTIGRQAAKIGGALLSGATIEDRIQFPAGSHITLNLEKIRAYGLEYNEGALAAVNSIIK